MVDFSSCDGTIKMTRGDSAQINLQIYINEQDLYNIKNGYIKTIESSKYKITDTITFSLFDKDVDIVTNTPKFAIEFSKPDDGKTDTTVKCNISSDLTKYLKIDEYFYNIILCKKVVKVDETTEEETGGLKEVGASIYTKETISSGRFFLVK